MLFRVSPFWLKDYKPRYDESGYTHFSSFIFDVSPFFRGLVSCKVVSHDRFSISHKMYIKERTLPRHLSSSLDEKIKTICSTHFKKNELVGVTYYLPYKILLPADSKIFTEEKEAKNG